MKLDAEKSLEIKLFITIEDDMKPEQFIDELERLCQQYTRFTPEKWFFNFK